MRILPYKMGSKGAKALADALGTQQVYRNLSNFHNNFNHTIINWGCSDFNSEFPVNRWINKPSAVKVAGNKLSCFNVLKETMPNDIPEFTSNHDTALDWHEAGVSFLSRTTLTGHSGQGITISREDGFVNAHLYVKYIKKTHEYRVHVMNGEVLDVQQKRKRQEIPNDDVNYQVRNHSNGWVYCRDAVTESHRLRLLACKAVAALDLDFGAVDIIYNEHQGKYYVLEVNTAVGLSGTTIDVYADGLRRLLG